MPALLPRRQFFVGGGFEPERETEDRGTIMGLRSGTMADLDWGPAAFWI
jgi:hypothetical protein